MNRTNVSSAVKSPYQRGIRLYKKAILACEQDVRENFDQSYKKPSVSVSDGLNNNESVSIDDWITLKQNRIDSIVDRVFLPFGGLAIWKSIHVYILLAFVLFY